MSEPFEPIPVVEYSEFRLPKKGGGVRIIHVADAETEWWNRNTLRILYETGYMKNPWARGGMPGVTLADNITPHKDNDDFYLVDVSDAFGSVDKDRLAAYVDSLRLRAEEEKAQGQPVDKFRLMFDGNYLKLFVFSPEISGLPQGNTLSPYLFNLYCQPLDEELGALCKDAGLTYTRWLDDFTFSAPRSGPHSQFSATLRKAIRSIIESYSLPVNHRKSQLHSLLRGPVTITGLSLYPDRRIQPSPALMQKMFAEFESLEETLRDPMIATDQMAMRSISAHLNGWNGVIELAGHKNRDEALPPTLERAKRLYHELSARAVALSFDPIE